MKTPLPAGEPGEQGELLVPFERVAKFVRQLTHDIRNGLSAIDLEAAFIAELVHDPEAAEEIRKLRGMVAGNARMLRDLSQHFQPIALHEMPWAAATFFGELHARILKRFPGETLEVASKLDTEQIRIDLEQMVGAMQAILTNAVAFRRDNGGPLRLSGAIEGEHFVMELREPKEMLAGPPPGEWGREPLQSNRPGGYGLGLYRARRVIEAHGGTLEISYKGSGDGADTGDGNGGGSSGGVLTTRVKLPLIEPE